MKGVDVRVVDDTVYLTVYGNKKYGFRLSSRGKLKIATYPLPQDRLPKAVLKELCKQAAAILKEKKERESQTTTNP